MRLVVLAYQEIGYVCLKSLLQAGADVALVLTHEDDPDEEIWFRSVAGLSREAGIRTMTPEDPNSPEIIKLVQGLSPDIIFSFYYRYMLADDFLASARIGAYNLHGSLLPAYRGRAPINWVLVNGETETGVTLHRMVARPDAGPIVAQRAVPISETDDVAGLYEKMTSAAYSLLEETWPKMAVNDFTEKKQDESLASYYGGRKPKDGLIDWLKPAKVIYNLCRAVTHPYPGAFTYCNGRKLYLWTVRYEDETTDKWSAGTVIGPIDSGLAVSCGRGRIIIESGQFEGDKESSGAGLLKHGLETGDVLG